MGRGMLFGERRWDGDGDGEKSGWRRKKLIVGGKRCCWNLRLAISSTGSRRRTTQFIYTCGHSL